MNRLVKYKRKSYTLVELMIAMAILVIMMGFLFQFLNSAQRLWSASSNSSQVFDTAQVIFDVIETDLKNALFSNQVSREIPIYHKETSSPTETHLGMFVSNETTDITDDIDKAGVHPVIFVFQKTENRIYRCAITQDTYELSDGTQISNIPVWWLVGSGFQTDFFASFLTSFFASNINKVDELAAGVEKFNVELFFPSGKTINTKGYAPVKPKAVKITLEIYDPGADLLEGNAKAQRVDETKRIFSKMIFL